jgi:hypothetical protein
VGWYFPLLQVQFQNKKFGALGVSVLVVGAVLLAMEPLSKQTP